LLLVNSTEQNLQGVSWQEFNTTWQNKNLKIMTAHITATFLGLNTNIDKGRPNGRTNFWYRKTHNIFATAKRKFTKFTGNASHNLPHKMKDKLFHNFQKVAWGTPHQKIG